MQSVAADVDAAVVVFAALVFKEWRHVLPLERCAYECSGASRTGVLRAHAQELRDDEASPNAIRCAKMSDALVAAAQIEFAVPSPR
jgi:hypothetical protein